MSSSFIKNLKPELRKILLDPNAKEWRECAPENPVCAICGKIIRGVPLRIGNDNKEVAAHINCAIINATPDVEDEEYDLGFSCLDCDQIQSCTHISDELKKEADIRNSKKNKAK